MKGVAPKSRADVVRKRRRHEAEKRVGKSAALAARPLTPIISRTGPLSAISQAAPPTGARRHYQTEISIPGIEVRMPAIHFVGPQVKWRVFSLILALMLGAAVSVAWNAPEFRVINPQVKGNERIAAEDLNAALGVGGVPIVTVVPADLEKRLRLTYPELLYARVSVSLPNNVSVVVKERTPVILWQQGGAYTWIADDGVAFRPRGPIDGLIVVQAHTAPPAAAVRGTDPLSPAPFLPADLVTAIKTLAPQVPQGAPILYDARYGLGWLDNRGWQAFFGSDAGDMTLRLQVYQSVVSMLDAKGITPALVSVQYPSAPYYRMGQ